jgi:hypothetical protein
MPAKSRLSLELIGAIVAVVSLAISLMPYLYDELYIKTPITLSGYINDTEGNPIANATVELEGFSVLTNSDGKFILKNISSGKKTIIIETLNSTNEATLLINRNAKNIEYNITLMDYTSEMHAQIAYPLNNAIVSAMFPIRGTISRPLKPEEHIWVAVNPLNSPGNWWPQFDSAVIPYGDGSHLAWEGVAYLGGNENDKFNVVVLLVDNTFNREIREWIKKSQMQARWDPITISNRSKILAEITVGLGNQGAY